MDERGHEMCHLVPGPLWRRRGSLQETGGADGVAPDRSPLEGCDGEEGTAKRGRTDSDREDHQDEEDQDDAAPPWLPDTGRTPSYTPKPNLVATRFGSSGLFT